MKKILFLFLILASPVIASADGAKRQTVEQLLKIMNVDETIDAMYSQMDSMFLGMAKEIGVKESEQQIFDKFMSNAAEAMKEEMTWDKMKEPMIDVYLKHYSEKEITDMLAFYNTESGKSIINKMPAVMEDSMLISQKMFKEFMPRLKELSTGLKQDLEQARRKPQ